MGRLASAVWATVLALSACGSEGGSVAVKLRWAEGPQDRPAPGETWIHLSIWQANGNQQLAEPLRLTPGVAFDVPDVPFGTGLVIEAVLRESQDPGSGRCCSGASEPFDFEAGSNVAVDIELTLDPNLALDARRISERVSLIRSPFGLERPEVDGRFNLPPGPYFGLAPSDAFDDVDTLPADAFQFVGGVAPRAVELLDAGGRLLARIEADIDGRWPRASLGLQDPSQVFVAGVGPRDVRSPAVPVTDAWYVLTTALFETASLTAADGVTWEASSCASWRPVGRPPARQFAAMATDTLRDEVVLFGGLDDAAAATNETWRYDGRTWTRLDGVQPPARSRAVLVYDVARDEMVLFGGNTAEPQLLNDTWVLDQEGWHPRAPTTVPRPRTQSAAAYDAARGRVLVFGGDRPEGRPTDELWAWDGSNWSEVDDGDRPPSPRSGAGMAYDSARQKVVVFGGYDNTGPRTFADTWSWDGTAWTEGPAGPPARLQHGMAYDPAESRIVVYGGFRIDATGNSPGFADTWVWNGDRWSQVAAGVNRPSARVRHGLATSPEGDGVLFFGGQGAEGLQNDTWLLRGSSWLSEDTGDPPPRNWASMTYDGARDELVLFGGERRPSGQFLNETWTWNEEGWRLREPANAPAPRFAAALGYDPVREEVVLFGGLSTEPLADTWRWNGDTWFEATPQDTPSPRVSASISVNPMTGRALLFGGVALGTGAFGDTWEWDGETWTPLPVSGPEARWAASIVYDPVRGQSLLFGGIDGPTGLNDTWSFQDDWVKLNPPSPRPSRRYNHAMAWDEARERIVMFGGFVGGGLTTNDTWEWDGQAWSQASNCGSAPPPVRTEHTMAYHAGTKQMVLYGGENRGDTYVRSASGRPAIQFEMPLPDSLTTDALRGVSVEAFCGGISADGGPGAQLLVRSKEDSLPVAVHSASTDDGPEQTALTWSIDAPVEAQRLFAGRQFTFQCRPLGEDNNANAVVAADAAELRIRYSTVD